MQTQCYELDEDCIDDDSECFDDDVETEDDEESGVWLNNFDITKYKPLFPYFGGKSKIAPVVWKALGHDVPNYVEPFAGSAAVLFARPGGAGKIETINDADGFISNLWRAIQADPEGVAHWADWPVSEIDLHARHAWLVNRRERLLWSLEDPDFYDSKIAGWWLWGACLWIGSGWCSGEGPWVSNGAHIYKKGTGAGEENGINRKLPHLGDDGRGINRKLPPTMKETPDTDQSPIEARRQFILEQIVNASNRLRHVRICNGDWSRVCGRSVAAREKINGIFLDPPYADTAAREAGLYAVDSLSVAHDVRKWAIENGDNPKLRIVLAGYEGEHEMPSTWRKIAWSTRGGYGSQGNGNGWGNKHRERLWLSPHCLEVDDHDMQRKLI